MQRRYSKQRELILNCLRATTEHPTAEMVYQWLKPVSPNLSRGTVYRNLNLLVEEGALVRMPFPVERYDARTAPHAHFRCDSCGCVSDLDLPYEATADQTAARQLGAVVRQHDLIFYGLCARCALEKGRTQ